MKKLVVFKRPGRGESALLLVPKVKHEHWSTIISAGSAIVGYLVEPGYYQLYYEGDLYSMRQTFEDRMNSAYDRLVTNYPTVAKVAGPVSEFEVIGEVGPAGFLDDIEESKLGLLHSWMSLDPRLGVTAPVPKVKLSDDEIRELEFKIETIGTIMYGAGDADQYLLVERLDGEELLPEVAQNRVSMTAYREGNDDPGTYFCHVIDAVRKPGSVAKCIVVVQHRYNT
jgi:hypothetical protein